LSQDYSFRQIGTLWLNVLTFCFLFGLAVNFSIVNWNWNPFIDFLFMRSHGPIFILNHYSSAILVVGTMLYAALRNPANAFRQAMPILGSVGVHEVALNFILWPVRGSLISWSYIVEMVFWAVLGAVIATRKQKVRLAKVSALMVVYEVGWALVVGLTHHNIWTVIVAGGINTAGPMYFDILDNSLEVFSWVVPFSEWFVPWV
jgi:hypothetical protein